MQFKIKDDVDYIIDQLSQLSAQIKMYNKIKLYDINIYMENFCIGLLNIAFDCNLKNLNDDHDMPSIDLGDDENRICIQVTSEKYSKKINDTLSKFIKYELHKRYDRLIVFILVDKQNKYTIKPELEMSCSFFDKNKDIYDFNTFLQQASNDPKKIRKIREYIEKEYPESYYHSPEPSFDRWIELLNAIHDFKEYEKSDLGYILLNGELLNKFDDLIKYDEQKKFMNMLLRNIILN